MEYATRFDNFQKQLATDNTDVATTQGSNAFITQLSNDKSNNIIHDNDNDDNDDNDNASVKSLNSQMSKISQISKSSKSNLPSLPSYKSSKGNILSPSKTSKVSFEDDENNTTLFQTPLTNNNLNLNETLKNETKNENPPKRGRGRPPKNQILFTDMVDKEEEDKKNKKKNNTIEEAFKKQNKK